MRAIATVGAVLLLGGCQLILGLEDPGPGGGDGDDDPIDAAASGPIRVTVYDFQTGSPQPDRAVFLHDAAGELLAETSTDGDGQAVFEDVAGGTVTIEGVSDRLHSWFGAEPGDSLVFGNADGIPEPVDATLTVTLPGPYDGATSYQLAYGCIREALDPDAPTTVPVEEPCSRQSQLDVMVAAFDAGQQLIAWNEQPLSLAAGDNPIEVVSWRTDLRTARFELTDAPEGAIDVAASGGAGPYTAGATVDLTPGGDAVVEYAYPAGIFYESHALSLLYEGGIAFLTVLGVHPDGYAIDLTTETLPPPREVALDDADPLRPRITWTTDRPPEAADFVFVQLGWTDADGVTVWTMVLPPDATEVQVPLLPASYPDGPSAASEYQNPIADLNGASYLDDYADARNGVGPQTVEYTVGSTMSF
jgi:hypothetical protein